MSSRGRTSETERQAIILINSNLISMRTVYQIASLPESGVRITLEGKLVRLLFDFEKVETVDEDQPVADDLYYCESIDVPGRGYGDIVSAIVNDRYPLDEKDAIMANYQLVRDGDCPSEKIEEYTAEYQALQQWRNRAKEVAKIVIANI